MKKILFLAAAVAALAACAKMVPDSNQNSEANVEIKFQTATYATKNATKAEGDPSVYTGDSFGTYAWSAASQLAGNIFMDDETVTKVSNVWKPSKTYYWPKTATVDFISYAPKDKTPEITQTSIKYTDYDLNTAGNSVDLLYADKAVGYGSNENAVTPSDYNGVPTIFRHALAKLSIDSKLAYDRKKQLDADATTYTVTKWAVKISSVTSAKIAMKGGVELALANPSTTKGTYTWCVKDNASNPQVWTPTSDAGTLAISTADQILSTGSATHFVTENYVIPQTLSTADGKAQAVTFNYEIQTFRKTGLTSADADTYLAQDITFYDGTGTKPADLFLIENGSSTANLKVTNISDFEMGHAYTYVLVFTPTNGTGKTPGDDPVDPNDPNLDDVTISFDPAVAGWSNVTATGTINI